MPEHALSATLHKARRSRLTALIVDVKLRSPRDGQLIPPQHIDTYVQALLNNSVDALATVTEPVHFGGSIAVASRIRKLIDGHSPAKPGAGRASHPHSPVPFMRKDFFKTVGQVDESYRVGFDALQLTLRTINDTSLVSRMKKRADELRMDAVIGVQDERELEQALGLDAAIVGINNRDIDTLEVDRGTVRRTEKLLALIPPEVLVISESGLVSPRDVQRASAAGADGVLIGTAIARSQDPAAAIERFRASLAGASRDRPHV
jgi:indole-3-glycerol phosphate synthase